MNFGQAQWGQFKWSLQGEVVDQKRDALARFDADHDPAQSGWVVLAGVEDREYTDLIADDGSGTVLHWIKQRRLN